MIREDPEDGPMGDLGEIARQARRTRVYYRRKQTIDWHFVMFFWRRHTEARNDFNEENRLGFHCYVSVLIK